VAGPLLLVDAPFLLFRSFFALPDSIQDGDGHSVNALLGTTNALLRVVADRDPRAVILCFGAEAAAYRVEMYADYHAHRPPLPDPLGWQFAQASDFFSAFGWSVHSSEDLEADDLLGSLAKSETEASGRALILTGDRDMYQCVDERVTVLYLKSGISGFEEVDAAEVKRRYGIPPALVADFIALRGDPSDGLPGARGIGPKTAAELLSRHGSLEAAIENARDEPGRVAATLRGSADELRTFKEIATLRQLALEPPPSKPTDLAAGAAAARRLGMRRLAERLEQAKAPSDL
jgi:DNA polymerase-1